jgi:NADH-quinone oxidoreductase subunit G
MTVTSPANAGPVEKREDLVTVTIDGFEVSVPKGTLLIRAAELLGIQIPRFCDHPLLDPVGACRQCLVEITDAGNGRSMPKPAASCTITVAEGMVVKTQLTSAVSDKAQQGIMELLLINHPLDCPICDKGGECPLQNQAMSNGRAESRFEGVKRTFPKPINISAQVLLDRERCVLCARCTRFSNQVAGDPFIEMLERGALQQVGIYSEQPFESYFSGNTIQICPVGALTGAAYRFRARPFDLVSSPGVCEHCASGCAIRTDHRRGKVLRRLAGDDPQVNEEWNCDKGRWAFQYATAQDRLTTPMVRDEQTGDLVAASWPEALELAGRGLVAARGGRGAAVLVGGRVTHEDAYAYAKFARVALGTNDVDFRARPHSAEEAAFLGAIVAGTGPGAGGVTYAELEAAPVVLLAALEVEEESPIIFLRLRKAARKRGLKVFGLAPFATRGLDKTLGRLIPTAPGDEAAVLNSLAESPTSGRRESPHAVGGAHAVDAHDGGALDALATGLRRGGAVILIGERLAGVPGALSAAVRLAAATGARLAWVPRRAGERGALEAGALPTVLPGGRPVADASARVDMATAWGVVGLPAETGRDTGAILAAAAAGEIDALVVGGLDPADLPDHDVALAAAERAFVVSLELRASAITDRADVVLPVAPAVEKSGTFLDWEGRERRFDQVLRTSNAMADLRVLDALAAEMGVALGTSDTASARREIAELGLWEGSRVPAPEISHDRPGRPVRPRPGQAVLASWHELLDAGRMQDGEPYLAATAKRAVARLSATTAAEAGVADGAPVSVRTDRGTITLPLAVTPMPDRVVWLPTNSAGSAVRRSLGVDAGSLVSISAASAATPPPSGVLT